MPYRACPPRQFGGAIAVCMRGLARTVEPRSCEHRRIDLAWDELASALRADHTTVLHHDLAPQHGEDGPALDLPAFPDAVITDVEVRHAQYLVEAGIN